MKTQTKDGLSIGEIQSLKKETETKIGEIIKNFNDKTQVRIASISLSYSQHKSGIGDDLPLLNNLELEIDYNNSIL
jgi:hypothetical protein